MIFSQNFSGLGQIKIVTGFFMPGNINHPVNISPNDIGFGSIRMHPLQPAKLFIRLFQCQFRHLAFFNLILKLLHLGRTIFTIAKLMTNRLHLLF